MITSVDDLVAAADSSTWTSEALAALTPAQEAHQVRAATAAVWKAVAAWQDGLTRNRGRHLRSTIGACPSRVRCVVCRVHNAVVALDQLPDDTDVETVIKTACPVVDVAVPPTPEIAVAVERLRAIGWHRHSLVPRSTRSWQWFTSE